MTQKTANLAGLWSINVTGVLEYWKKYVCPISITPALQYDEIM